MKDTTNINIPRTVKTVLHFYEFNTRSDEELKEYARLRERLTKMGYSEFDVLEQDNGSYMRKMALLDGKEIELETKYLFSNQWNTVPIQGVSDKGLRVMDWREEAPLYSNRLKRGYWLEQTDEMRRVREAVSKCGYCGSAYPTGQQEFCSECLGSPFLEEKDLPLLRTLPVARECDKRNELTDDEKAELMPKYIEAQTKRKAAEKEKLIAKLNADYDKAVTTATAERDGMLWLLERDINIENVIFYNHTGKFSFGWRKPIIGDVRKRLEELLKDFPYEYEIKKD